MDWSSLSREDERIARLAAVYGASCPPGVRRGIGDDAAVLDAARAALVWSVDVMVEGVHFLPTWLSWTDLGYRATMTAASDLAAMGAQPRGILCSLVLPDRVGDDALDRLAQGQQQACDELGTAILGGNLARGRELSITTTVLGEASHPLGRQGMGAGDTLFLCGAIGWAALGREILSRATAAGAEWQADPRTTRGEERAVQAYRRPRAHLAAGLTAGPIANAGIDLSDGLACDLGRLLRASSPQGPSLSAVLAEHSLIDPELVPMAAELDRDPLELALYGGEDYALLVSAPAHAPLPGFRPIGRCEIARQTELAVMRPSGERLAVRNQGFDHFGW